MASRNRVALTSIVSIHTQSSKIVFIHKQTVSYIKRKSLTYIHTYRSSGFVVVKIHLLSEAAPSFSGVDELPGELVAEADVVRTAAPLPVANALRRRRGAGVGRAPRLVTVVAGTRLDAALAARPRHGVRHRRAGDGVNERRLSTPCQTNNFSLVN